MQNKYFTFPPDEESCVVRRRPRPGPLGWRQTRPIIEPLPHVPHASLDDPPRVRLEALGFEFTNFDTDLH